MEPMHEHLFRLFSIDSGIHADLVSDNRALVENYHLMNLFSWLKRRFLCNKFLWNVDVRDINVKTKM